jgi:hypothetical protein
LHILGNQPNATVNQPSNVSNPQPSPEEIAAAVAREKDLVLRALIRKHGLNVNILNVDSCKRIVEFLEKSPDRTIQNSYVRGYEKYRDLAYFALDELLQLLYNYTLYQIQLNLPGRLEELILQLNCHSLGGEWLKGLEITLSSGSAKDFDRLNNNYRVEGRDLISEENTREDFKF